MGGIGSFASGDTDGAILIYSAFLQQVPASTIGRDVAFEIFLDVPRSLLIAKAWAKVREIAEHQLFALVPKS